MKIMFESPLQSSHETPLYLSEIYPPWREHDRVNKFIVENGKLFWKPLKQEENEDREWVEVELPEGRTPHQPKADWENLMVLDTDGDVHYTKSCDGTETLMTNPKWSSGIWVLPVVSEIFNRFIYQDPNFTVPDGGAWDCSYLEEGSFYLDALGRQHGLGENKGEIEATTTAYVADTKTRRFRFYDPYIPKSPEDSEKLFIPFPETSETTFDLKGCSSCRSGLFCIGYDVSQAEPKVGVVKELAMYYIPVDANLLGLNPMISYTYSSEPESETDFVLPASHHQRISLPQGLGVELTGIVGMERAEGKAMTDVVLTVEGKRVVEYDDGVEEEEKGFFYKKPCDEEWQFKPMPSHLIDPDDILVEKCYDQDEVFSTTVFNFFGHTVDGEHDAKLKNFGHNSLISSISVTIDGIDYGMQLYTQESQWNLIGFDWKSYVLFIPMETREMLGWESEEVVIVKVKIHDEHLVIRDKRNKKDLFHFPIEEETKAIVEEIMESGGCTLL